MQIVKLDVATPRSDGQSTRLKHGRPQRSHQGSKITASVEEENQPTADILETDGKAQDRGERRNNGEGNNSGERW